MLCQYSTTVSGSIRWELAHVGAIVFTALHIISHVSKQLSKSIKITESLGSASVKDFILPLFEHNQCVR